MSWFNANSVGDPHLSFKGCVSHLSERGHITLGWRAAGGSPCLKGDFGKKRADGSRAAALPCGRNMLTGPGKFL